MKRGKEDYFSSKMFLRQFIPALISAVVLALGDMADAIVVGNRMGVTGLAAISLTLPVFMIINLIMHGFGVGGAVRFSKQLAQGEEKTALAGFQGIIEVALFIGVGLSVMGNVFINGLLAILGADPAEAEVFAACRDYVRLIVTFIPLFFVTYILNYYLRNDDKEKLAGFGFTAGNLTDIVLNIVLVLFCHQGVTGAAWATIIGLMVSLCIYLTGMTGKKGVLRLSPWKPDFHGILKCYQTGFSTSSQYLLTMIFLLMANRTLMKIGGSLMVGIFDMIQNVSYLILYLYEGTGKAMQPLASTYYGERNQKECRGILRKSLRYGTAAGIAAGLLIALFADQVCGIFGIYEGESLKVGIYALRVYVIGTFAAGISVLLEAYFQSTGRERSAFVLVLLRGTVVLLPLLVLFAGMGTYGFWWLFPVTEILSLVLLYLRQRLSHEKEAVFDEEKVYYRTIRNSSEDLTPLLSDIETFCEKWGSTAKQQYFMNMAVEELCVAIMKHGFENDYGYIQVTLLLKEDGLFELHIRDNAVSFNPFAVEEKETEEEFDFDVLGINVIKKKGKEFYYRRYQGFNTLVVKI